MNGGESRTETAVARMLDELKYQSEIKQSSTFAYTTQYVKGIGRYLDTAEQHNVLKLMDTRGIISLSIQEQHNHASSGFALIEGKDSSLTRSLMTTEYVVDVTNTEWPITTIANVDKRGQHTARLILEDTHLKVILDNNESITIRLFQSTKEPSDPYKLFLKLFSQQIGHILRLNDIFPNYKSLKKVLTDAKLGYLLPIFFTDRGSRELQLLEMPVKISDTDYELLLSKNKEKVGKV